MLSITLLVSGMFLLTTLKVNLYELGSQDTTKTLPIDNVARSNFTIFDDKFPGDIYFTVSWLFEITFTKLKPPSFKRATTSVMIFTAVCGSAKESK